MDTVLLDEIEQRLDGSSARALAEAVVACMADGAVATGTRLPPIRTVARELSLSPTTVSAAWALLRRSATIRTDGRRGTVVVGPRSEADSRYRAALDHHDTTFALDLSTGVPDPALLPDLRPALRSLSSRATRASYLDAAVLPELSALLRDDWPFPVEEISIHDGAMDALDLMLRTVVGFGDRVVVENPGFPPLVDLLESLGAVLVPVTLDARGVRPDALARALRVPVAAVVLQPRAQNPTGVSVDPSRAAALATVLGASSAWVVEDDSAGSVASSPDVSLGRWLPTRVVHVRSFAKSHGPDLRLAALSAPDALLDRLLATRRLGQGWTSRLLQQVLIGLLTEPRSVAAVTRARGEYRRRRRAMVAALAARDVAVGGNDGINLWLPVLDETAAAVRLAARGIGVAQGSPFWTAGGPPHVRVTCGLFDGDADRLERLADELATATRVGAWSGRR